tara:strand:- start:1824 stop:2051 length:228 start_codon:yes stop_codon:yes gene_type:complete
MNYSSCPTCYFFIGNLIEEFENEKEKICSNSKLTEEEQEKEISNLLRNLKVRRYCCRMRIMTNKDMVKEIMSVSN